MEEIDLLSAKQLNGQINQFTFTQPDVAQSFRVNLVSFRQVVEGVRLNENEDQPNARNLLALHFGLMNFQVMKELDPCTKVIKITFPRKFSESYQEYCKKQRGIKIKNMIQQQSLEDIEKDYFFVFNYQLSGQDNDNISMAMYSLDLEKNAIDTKNFLILTQKTRTHADPQEN
jgi:hypothetical protein